MGRIFEKIRLIFLLILLHVQPSQADTLHVYPGANHLGFTQAVKNARNGSVLIVHKGVYYVSDLTIDKKLIIKGVDNPVIDGRKISDMITITHSGVVIQNLTICNSGTSGYNDIAALRIKNCRSVSVLGNIFRNNYFAVFCQNVSGCLIKNNHISSNAVNEVLSANGIHCWKSDSLSITGNKVNGHRDGIYFEFVTNSHIQSNLSQNNVRYGLHFMFSHHNSYSNNTFKNNGAGVAVMYTQHVEMINNSFIDNWGNAAFGMLIKDITDSRIIGNKFVSNTCGIFMEGGNRLQINSNVFKNNGWALKIQANCSDNRIWGNNFLNNSFDIGTNGDLVLNTFNGNFWDHYNGYDLNRDGIGDVPYRPVSMYSVIIENNPSSLMLYRSLLVQLLDQAEKSVPGFTPENLKDNKPLMKALKL